MQLDFTRTKYRCQYGKFSVSVFFDLGSERERFERPPAAVLGGDNSGKNSGLHPEGVSEPWHAGSSVRVEAGDRYLQLH